jgi:putative hydrolase of HD superfamily
MLVVAMLSYFCSVQIGACNRRICNNFFAGLLHDLPEVLTRDIVSPVKRSVEGLEEIIKTYERIHLEERILPLLPSSMRDEVAYFIEDEFSNKIILDGEIVRDIPENDMMSKYNEDRYSSVDGELIRCCDKLAAFIEASLSIEHGIKSSHLVEGKRVLYEAHKGEVIGDFAFLQLFDYFN